MGGGPLPGASADPSLLREGEIQYGRKAAEGFPCRIQNPPGTRLRFPGVFAIIPAGSRAGFSVKYAGAAKVAVTACYAAVARYSTKLGRTEPACDNKEI